MLRQETMKAGQYKPENFTHFVNPLHQVKSPATNKDYNKEKQKTKQNQLPYNIQKMQLGNGFGKNS